MRRYFTWEEAEAGHREIVDGFKRQYSIAKGALQKILDATKEK